MPKSVYFFLVKLTVMWKKPPHDVDILFKKEPNPKETDVVRLGTKEHNPIVPVVFPLCTKAFPDCGTDPL